MDVTDHSHGSSDPADGGDVSSPQDTRGEGTVSLEDRTEPGGQGSPDTNQSKSEPMPPTPGHADPDSSSGPHTEPPSVPDLGSMNAGAANSQVARPSGAGLAAAARTARPPPRRRARPRPTARRTAPPGWSAHPARGSRSRPTWPPARRRWRRAGRRTGCPWRVTRRASPCPPASRPSARRSRRRWSAGPVRRRAEPPAEVTTARAVPGAPVDDRTARPQVTSRR